MKKLLIGSAISSLVIVCASVCFFSSHGDLDELKSENVEASAQRAPDLISGCSACVGYGACWWTNGENTVGCFHAQFLPIITIH